MDSAPPSSSPASPQVRDGLGVGRSVLGELQLPGSIEVSKSSTGAKLSRRPRASRAHSPAPRSLDDCLARDTLAVLPSRQHTWSHRISSAVESTLADRKRLAGVMLMAFAVFLPMYAWLASSAQTVSPPATSKAHPAHTVEALLRCPGARADLLDILAGAPFEFGSSKDFHDRPDMLRLHHLALRAAIDSAATSAEAAQTEADLIQELKKLAGDVETGSDSSSLNAAATAEEWPPPALRARVRNALATGCHLSAARLAAVEAATVALEVDLSLTSPSAHTPRGWLHRLLLSAGAATGLSRFRERAERFRPQSASVITSGGPPIVGECLALRGVAPTVALRVRGNDEAAFAFVTGLALHHPPRWATARPRSAPRRFDVYGEAEVAASKKQGEADSGGLSHVLFLGSFEYSLAAPAAQQFSFQNATPPLRGLRIVFDGQGWGEDFLCIYKIRALRAEIP